MKVICVNNWEELKDIRSEYNQKYDNEVFFRGTSKPLISSLVEKCSYKTYEDLACKEFEMLSEFRAYSNLSYRFKNKNEIATDWEIRIAAREHNLASSLMDWSNDLELAVEFAIRNFIAKNIHFTSVWFLVKKNIPQIELGESMSTHFKDVSDPSIISYPSGSEFHTQIFTRRKFIQGGYFLKLSYLDQIKPIQTNPFFEDKLLQVIITTDVVSKMFKSLKVDLKKDAMIEETQLDKVCEQLNTKYS
jgi:hypothetical protein